MRPPRIPPMLTDIVQTALSVCDGIVFDSRKACRWCGGQLSGYDTKKKKFAVIVDNDRIRHIHVNVKRFLCHRCNTVCSADEPFYPDTRIGSPVVDLCVTLAATMPFTRTARYLSEMGVVIDRGSVRNFSMRGFSMARSAEVFGIRLPMSVISLSTLAASVGEGGRIEGAEALVACGFPSAYRAAPEVLLPPEQGDERDEQDKKEERQVKLPHQDGERK